MSTDLPNLLNAIFKDKQGKIAILQLPNTSLTVWGIATIATHILHNPWRNISSIIALVAIITWAGIEILTGSSLFRRLLGAVVLAAVVLRLIFK